MKRLNALLTTATVALTATGAVYAQPAPGSGARAQAVTQIARAAGGSLHGVVKDENGGPLEGVTVSAIGETMVFAVTDGKGRFGFDNLPAGRYLLRAHRAGFSLADREYVQVRESARIVKWLELRRGTVAGTSGSVEPEPRVLAAGLGGETAPETTDAAAVAEGERPRGSHPHTEAAWRLRHARRSVLKDSSEAITLAGGDATGLSGGSDFTRGVPAFSALFGLPFSGEINFLTTSAFDRAGELFGRGLPRGVTYVQLGRGEGTAAWAMQAAVSQGDVSSWIVAGSFAARGPRSHALDLGVSYGAQAYAGGNPAALAVRSDGTRRAGAMYAYDNWAVSPRVHLAYGARLARYDYVDREDLWNPRVAIGVNIARGTFVRAAVSQGFRVPGAEEFLPPQTGGPWLPPERTFSPLVGDEFRVERIRRLELTLEREFHDSVIALRRFVELVDDQLVTVFGAHSLSAARSDVGHYLVGTAGAVDADGWGVKVTTPAANWLRGSVDYSLTRANWAPAGTAELVRLAPSAVRFEREDVHDVATSVEADISETATRVFFFYRISTGYSRGDEVAHPVFGARFDFQVKQALPFIPLRGSEWQVLVGIRDLFRDPLESSSSTYDELLVIRPPKRIVGGVQVKF